MTAELLWHKQNCDLIWLLFIKQVFCIFFARFRSWAHNFLWNGLLNEIKALGHNYRGIPNTSRTKSQNLNVFHLIVQLTLCSVLKPGDKSRMKM